MTPGMYITTVICIAVVAVFGIVFLSPNPNNTNDKDNKGDKE